MTSVRLLQYLFPSFRTFELMAAKASTLLCLWQQQWTRGNGCTVLPTTKDTAPTTTTAIIDTTSAATTKTTTDTITTTTAATNWFND